MLTPELIKEMAPRARTEYIKSLTSDAGWQTLARYKITDSLERLAGFLANCMHETGGLTIVRESLNYKTPARLRQVWPSRFGSKSEAELLKLCGNEKGLAALVYNGRMGNRPGTDDGYNFRGAGYLQTTGRENFLKYGKLAGIDFSTDPPPSTDDTDALLLMSAAEWAAGRCNELCQGGNFAGACAVINVGSAARIGSVVGMSERQKWYRQITRTFGEYENVLEPPMAPPAPAPAAAPPGAAPTPASTAPPAVSPEAQPPSPGTAPPEAATPSSAPPPTTTAGAAEGDAASRGLGLRPRLRRKPISRAPVQRHWYDFITRWFRRSEETPELPAVVLRPELARVNEDDGDPTYRHPTDKD